MHSIQLKQTTYNGVIDYGQHQCVNGGCFSLQIRQQEEVEKKSEVAMEMSDLVVYCQPRSKEKDRFGKRMQMLPMNTKICECI